MHTCRHTGTRADMQFCAYLCVRICSCTYACMQPSIRQSLHPSFHRFIHPSLQPSIRAAHRHVPTCLNKYPGSNSTYTNCQKRIEQLKRLLFCICLGSRYMYRSKKEQTHTHYYCPFSGFVRDLQARDALQRHPLGAGAGGDAAWDASLQLG